MTRSLPRWLALPPTEQRSAFRLSRPRHQVGLAAALLGVSALFAALSVANLYAAYGPLLRYTIEAAPAVYGDDIVEQTTNYVVVSSALVVAYALAIAGLGVAYVHRVAGPTVELERHVRALRRGDTESRVRLRHGQSIHGGLAKELNSLAEVMARSGARPEVVATVRAAGTAAA